MRRPDYLWWRMPAWVLAWCLSEGGLRTMLVRALWYINVDGSADDVFLRLVCGKVKRILKKNPRSLMLSVKTIIESSQISDGGKTVVITVGDGVEILIRPVNDLRLYFPNTTANMVFAMGGELVAETTRVGRNVYASCLHLAHAFE